MSVSRDKIRSARPEPFRAVTAGASLIRRDVRLGRQCYPEADRRQLPLTRRECPEGPCPYVSCRYHLYLDVHPRTGAIKLNFPHLEPDELRETCVLRVAERGATLQRVGRLLNLTRERVRQIQNAAIERVGHGLEHLREEGDS